MSPSRAILLLAGLASCLLEAAGRAPAPPRRDPGPPERPLPPAAVARLGSARLRHDTEVCVVAFSPDGRQIASVSEDAKVRVWEAATGRLLHEFDVPGTFSADPFHKDKDFTAAFTPDGKTLALGRGADVCFWEVRSGREVRRFRGTGDGVTALTLSSDDKTFYFGGRDDQLHQWDIATGKRLRSWDYFGDDQPKRYVSGRPSRTADLKAVSADGKKAVWEITSWEDAGTGWRWDRRWLTAWDVAARKDRWRLVNKAGDDFIRVKVVFSRDGKYLTAYENGSPLTVWNADSGKAAALGAGDAIDGVAYSPDSRFVAATTNERDYGLSLWDLASGKKLWHRGVDLGRGGGWGESLAFAPDGKTVAYGYRKNVLIWDVKSGEECPALDGHRWPVGTLAFSPKGDGLISADYTSVCEWDGRGRQTTRRPLIPSYGDARTVAASFERGLRIHQTKGRPPQLRGLISDKLVGEFEGGNAEYHDGCFSADGRTAVLFTAMPGKEFVLFDVPTLEARSRSLIDAELDQTPTLSPDGKLLAAPCSDRTVLLVDTSTGKAARRLGLPARRRESLVFPASGRVSNVIFARAAFSPDGRLVACGTNMGWIIDSLKMDAFDFNDPPGPPGLRVWDVRTGRELRQFGNFKVDDPNASIWTVRFSPDGKSLAVATALRSSRRDESKRFAIPVLEVASGQIRRNFEGHTGGIDSIAFSPDGKTLASGSIDTTILLWDMKRRMGPAPVARTPAERLRSYWADLASEDAARAYDASLAFEAMPGPAVAFLAERVKPAGVSSAEVARAVADLDADSFRVREEASARLAAWGEMARPSLTKALKGEVSPEVRRRLRKLLHATDAGYHPPAQMRELRAVEILDRVGTPEARRVLDTLAAGAAEASLTREARAALGRRPKARRGGE